ncbi:MAG: hypothetical protein JEZ00_18245 [Anaerolineaceae bacterium]|nr:hypothetical protein [Anaerolineaceae bacterium]
MSEENYLYKEKIQSNSTLLLFVVLTIVFLISGLWRMITYSLDSFAMVLFFFAAFFLFYSINYRTLIITITADTVLLRFGVFKWETPMQEIMICELDDKLPNAKKYGGAGIHFMFIEQRYRVSFNFLEHDRVVIRQKGDQKRVKDVSFSTQNANEIIRIIKESLG